MKLSEYARKYGITYRTAFRWWQNGQIKGFQKPSGTIIVTGGEEPPVAKKVVSPVVIYARVTSRETTSRFRSAGFAVGGLLCNSWLSGWSHCQRDWLRSQRQPEEVS